MKSKHQYIRPYRAQTNEKIECFWKTIEENLLAENYFENYEHLQKQLTEYLYTATTTTILIKALEI